MISIIRTDQDLQKNKPLADIKEFSLQELSEWLAIENIAPYRAMQILKWVYIRQADDFTVMTDLGKPLREFLQSHFTISRLTPEKIQIASDGTRKYLFRLFDGNCIESVLIPERDHFTLCVSTQVGCAQGCRFCRTAELGFVRNLTKGEIISQVRDIMHELKKEKKEHGKQPMPLTNLVFMGMGEPLANYTSLVEAIEVITGSDYGLKLANRRVTVSTAGLVPKIEALGRDTRVKLAVSLNAADNATRDRLMPVNRVYPIELLIEALKSFPLQTGRMITIEYILMQGINDSDEDARKLARLLHGIRAKINLIPFNSHDKSHFRRPEPERVEKFREILIRKNYTAIVRMSKGEDIAAACGQLAGKG